MRWARARTRCATHVPPSRAIAHARGFQDLAPLLEIVAEIRLERCGVAAFGFDTERTESLARFRIREQLADVRRDFMHHVLRRSAWPEETIPDVHFEARQARFGDRRHVRELGRALE